MPTMQQAEAEPARAATVSLVCVFLRISGVKLNPRVSEHWSVRNERETNAALAAKGSFSLLSGRNTSI